MQVFVKNLEGNSIAYTVDSSFTSADVKDLIEVRDSRTLTLLDTVYSVALPCRCTYCFRPGKASQAAVRASSTLGGSFKMRHALQHMACLLAAPCT